MTRYVYCLTIYGLWLRPALSRFPVGIPAIQAGTEAIPYEIGNFPADASPGPVAGVERVALRRQMSSGQPTGRWRASPMATGAALGSEWPERRSQRRSGRAIQFPGDDEIWLPEWSGKLGGAVGRSVARGSWGQSFGLRHQARWRKVWCRGGCQFSATERAHKRNAGRLTRNGGGRVWSRPPRKLLQMEPNGKKPIKMRVV